MTHSFDPTILREYDIRGIFEQTLFEKDARAVGQVFGTILRRTKGEGARVCVGYDGRLSSPTLEAALVEGLKSTGVNVERVGRGPTPMLYYATMESGADGGIMAYPWLWGGIGLNGASPSGKVPTLSSWYRFPVLAS